MSTRGWTRRILTATVVICAMTAPAATGPGATILKVDASVAVPGLGDTWDNAFDSLQDALDHVDVVGPPVEIWVADGTYRPDLGMSVIPGDDLASFELRSGVAIYGGFAGDLGGETMLDQRDLAANRAILSGDLVTDQSNTVVTSTGQDGTAILDGFTIMDGNADLGAWTTAAGGGLFVDGGAATIANCIFMGVPIVQVLRNDLIQAGLQLIFAEALELSTAPNPVLVDNGDLDNDGDGDLVAVNAAGAGGLMSGGDAGARRGGRGGRGALGSGAGAGAGRGAGPMAGGSVQIELNTLLDPIVVPPCEGDTDGSGAVDIDDIVNVILDFGTDGSANGGDVDGSGTVDIDDVVLVVLNFGPCV